jgi:dTDP-4-amino-4,6-dideoxygalactose transaminase
MKEFLPYNQPFIGDAEIEEVIDTLKSGWLTMGPRTLKFEQMIADYCNVENAVAVSSCSAGLHLSLIGLDIGPGDEVITTPFTFAATANAIIHTGATPVFADITEDTYNIDPDKVNELITQKTRAVIAVDYAGHPCDLDALNEMAADNNLFLVEDAAHSLGAEYKGEKIGGLCTATCLSFYATKNITTGEGGAVTTDDAKLAERLQKLRLHGMSKHAWKRYSTLGDWYYDIEECGWKYNMSDLQAALGIHQIQRIDWFSEVRRRYAALYQEGLGRTDGVILPVEKPDVKHTYHLFPILLKGYDRRDFINAMQRQGIGCSVHFIPLHLQSYYQKTYGYERGDFPRAEQVYEREVSLPLYPKMSENDVKYVISAVKRTLE